jgi:hypothetical protein
MLDRTSLNIALVTMCAVIRREDGLQARRGQGLRAQAPVGEAGRSR